MENSNDIMENSNDIMENSNDINISEIKHELNKMRQDIRQLINKFEDQFKIILDIQKYIISNKDENIKQNFNFERLDKGFNLEKSFISTCLNKENIIGDINLFKEYYLRSDIIIPFRKTGSQLEYYNKKWILNENQYMENIILENIINTYLEDMQNEDCAYDGFYNTGGFKLNIKHTSRLGENKTYRKNIIKEIFDLIEKI